MLLFFLFKLDALTIIDQTKGTVHLFNPSKKRAACLFLANDDHKTDFSIICICHSVVWSAWLES